jgi:hypothetical protein
MLAVVKRFGGDVLRVPVRRILHIHLDRAQRAKVGLEDIL